MRRAAADACKRCLCEWAPLCVKELDDQADGGVFLVPDAIGRIRSRYGCICIFATIVIHLNSGNVARAGNGSS